MTTKIKIFKFFTPFNYALYDYNIKVQILFPWVTTLRHKIYIYACIKLQQELQVIIQFHLPVSEV